MAFSAVGMEIEWVGRGGNERGVCPRTGRVLVCINPDYYRAAEVDLLRGDPAKAEQVLGWKHATTLEQLCAVMVEADLERHDRQLALRDAARNIARRRTPGNGASRGPSPQVLSESAVASPAMMPLR